MHQNVQTTSLSHPGGTDLVFPRRGEFQRAPSPQQKAAQTRRRREQSRQVAAWLRRITPLMDLPPTEDRWLVGLDVRDGDIESALDVSIAEVREAMRPLRPDEIEALRNDGVEDPGPLTHDVALARGGRILAVVQASADGPIVTRFQVAGLGSPKF